jgi:hypothetical protein
LDPGSCLTKNFCAWTGITCTDDRKNVKEIHIGACNVQGAIPTSAKFGSIFALSFVDVIFISPGPNLFLAGELPNDWSSKRLAKVQLTGHKISGTIPSSLFHCTALTQIDLHSNALNGHLAAEIIQLQQLVYLSVANNQLHGKLPKLPPKLTTL